MQDGSLSADTSQLVWDIWKRHAIESPDAEAIIHWDALEEPFRWTRSALIEEALSIASRLVGLSVKHGDVCALIMRHNKLFYPIYMGISAIGAIPAVLAYPNARLHPDKFVSGLSGIAQKTGLDWVVTERSLEPIIKPLVSTGQGTLKGILFPLEFEGPVPNKEINDKKVEENRKAINSSMPFLLQFSSGTTGLQKGVVLSHAAVLEHVNRYAAAIKMDARDKVVSWLPLYHDMGMIAAFHMPLTYGIPIVQMDPFQWILAPALLFQVISEEKATLAWLPNFAYDFMADRIRDEDIADFSVSSMRMFINCSEVVRHKSHEKFFNCFAKYGVNKNALAACYAMAETTYAVTQTEPGREASALAVDRESLLKKTVKPADNPVTTKICVSSGRPISGCSLKIVDKSGNALSEDRVGGVTIRSVSVFDGYLNNTEKTKEAIRDGWYVTRDLGFCHDGEYYILGREDDVIIVAGNNIYPEDVEDAVNRVTGIIPGRVIAFSVDDQEAGTQKVGVIAETACEDEKEKESLKIAVMQAGMAIDVTISSVYLVVPRWLIKSSSGKLSRKANKERILSGDGTSRKDQA